MKVITRQFWRNAASCAAMAVLALAPTSSWGEESDASTRNAPILEAPVANPEEIPEEVKDTAFDRFVDLHEIGRAWARLDASALADVALQLREGERVLLRSHKAIKASKVMDLALNLAVKSQDKEALGRLANAAKNSGDQDLAQKITAATQLASASRSPEAPFMVSLTETSVEGFTEIQGLLKQLNSARIAADTVALDKVIEAIAQSHNLTDKLRAQLTQAAIQAKSGAAPHEGSQSDPTLDTLNKLAASSRGNSDYYYGIQISGRWSNCYFPTYALAVYSHDSNSKTHTVSAIQGPTTVVLFTPDTVARQPLPPGTSLHTQAGTGNKYIGPTNDCATINKVISMANTGGLVASGAGNLVASGAGNLVPGRSVQSVNGVTTLVYVKKPGSK